MLFRFISLVNKSNLCTYVSDILVVINKRNFNMIYFVLILMPYYGLYDKTTGFKIEPFGFLYYKDT